MVETLFIARHEIHLLKFINRGERNPDQKKNKKKARFKSRL
jgi:hypothetical protein